MSTIPPIWTKRTTTLFLNSLNIKTTTSYEFGISIHDSKQAQKVGGVKPVRIDENISNQQIIYFYPSLNFHTWKFKLNIDVIIRVSNVFIYLPLTGGIIIYLKSFRRLYITSQNLSLSERFLCSYKYSNKKSLKISKE